VSPADTDADAGAGVREIPETDPVDHVWPRKDGSPTIDGMDSEPQPKPVTRASEKRWLGGVCQGIGEARGVSPAWLRLAFIALALVGGLGSVLYLAAWLILPSRSGSSEAPAARGVVVLVKAVAGLVGLTVLAVAGAAATVFGYGWVVFGVAAAGFIGALAVKRLGLGWALLPVVALTVPAAALAAEGVQLTPSDGAQTYNVPARALAAHGGRTYRSGLGTLLLDLRHTPLPSRGMLTLHIHAGIRRTIVALPMGECVNVVVDRHVNPFPVRAARLLTGRTDQSFADLFLFGRDESAWMQSVTRSPVSPGRPGPTLTIDFVSEGGSLYVRNYPDDVSPDLNPYWPGFPVFPELRPPTRGLSKRVAHTEIRAWRARHAREVTERRHYMSLVGGPCARTSHRTQSGDRPTPEHASRGHVTGHAAKGQGAKGQRAKGQQAKGTQAKRSHTPRPKHTKHAR